MQPDAILATNTSAISVTGIAEASGRPDRVGEPAFEFAHDAVVPVEPVALRGGGAEIQVAAPTAPPPAPPEPAPAADAAAAPAAPAAPPPVPEKPLSRLEKLRLQGKPSAPAAK